MITVSQLKDILGSKAGGKPISKIPNFWEENGDIYLSFIQTSLKLICYPFFRIKKKAIS